MSAEEQSEVWRLRQVRGDLFTCPAHHALAHCISQDVRMGAGIALTFRNRFGGVKELLDQNKKTGDCAVLQRDGRFVYYLITKKLYNHKPTHRSLQQSLEAMRNHCVENGVSYISMPRIGCGLDCLRWESVSEIIRDVFQDTSIHMTVYSL